MKQQIIRFVLSAALYAALTAFTKVFLIFPSEIFSVVIFLPPIMGIIWGLPAVLGICLGGMIAIPLFNIFGSFYDITSLARIAVYLFMAGYLPHFFWNKWRLSNSAHIPFYSNRTLKKFLKILFVTFAATSVVRGVAATESHLELIAGLFGFSKVYTVPTYILACFLNDFLIAVFFDLVLFFCLASGGLNSPNMEERKAILFALLCYCFFPIAFAYLDIHHIYGMNDPETWISFIFECVAITDVYHVLMIYLMLKHRRSIMVEIVFLVAITVFISAAVLGGGASVSMISLVNSHINDNLRGMGVICRERLDRTFFCVRQAVNGMERQATQFLESYDKLTKDPTYREEYLKAMEKSFSAIAMDTDGCLAYYLRLDPKIAGYKGGFSMAREDNRWEGALSPFVEREPIDLSDYSPNNNQKVGWYYTPYRSKCATWIEPYIDELADSYVISYVAPLFVEDKFIGVIGIDIDFNFIIQELRRMSIYDYGYVYLMNRNNVVLYHKDQKQGEIFQPNSEFQEMEIYLTNGMWLGIATPLNEVHDMRNHILMHLIAAILIVAMLVSLGSIFLVSRAIRPLKGMTDAAKRIASGDLNVQISYESGNELGVLVQSIREMASRLETYVYRDKLTGLRNAAAYMNKSLELNNQSKTNKKLNYAIIIFDVNFLKKVNDNYGHQAGNNLLSHAAAVMSRVFEDFPTYRIGGDEFAAVVEDEDPARIRELMSIFDEEIAKESFEAAGDQIFVSVARGAGFYKHGMEFADVVKKADVEMYAHKSAIKAKYGEEVR